MPSERAVSEAGSVSDALSSTARDDLLDARALARRMCQACVDKLGIDGAATN
jgi:hypothetical protein